MKTQMKLLNTFLQALRGMAKIFALAARKFIRIDGPQRAEAFSYNAFFSLFPMVVIFVSIASAFINHDMAGKFVIGYVEKYVPISGEMQHYIFKTIRGVVNSRGQAGLVAGLMLVWVAAQFLTTLVQAANRAWGIEGKSWWHLPLKGLALLFIMAAVMLAGLGVPALVKIVHRFFPEFGIFPWLYSVSAFFLPWLVFFLGLSFFYQLAPQRRTRFSEVWAAALASTVLLQAAQRLFIMYLKDFAALNAVYGAFGGIIALLLWIYLSGCILIFGACLCAAQAETRAPVTVNKAFQVRS